LIEPTVAEDAPTVSDHVKSSSKHRNTGDLTDPHGSLDAPPPMTTNKMRNTNKPKKIIEEQNFDPNDHIPGEVVEPQPKSLKKTVPKAPEQHYYDPNDHIPEGATKVPLVMPG
jgi:hypothetical protein